MSRSYGLVPEMDFRRVSKKVRGGTVECPFCFHNIRGDKFYEHVLSCEELKAEVQAEVQSGVKGEQAVAVGAAA